jgi:acetate kinase
VRVLVVNAGSSSLKLRVLGPEDDVLASADLAATAGRADEDELARTVAAMPRPDAVGHRIVHGGERYSRAVRVDRQVAEDLRALTELAPLHQPKALAALEAVTIALPDLPAVACFDTAFHATLPPAAATYALPAAWRERWPIRRYGFHGLSHAYAARRAAALLGRDDLRLVTCHLGAGASLAAIEGGTSVDTTMGFTPLEGLVMASRSGTVDPGLVLWLVERLGVEAVAAGLEHESGLAGLGGTADMREVLQRSERGDEAARLALDAYVHRLCAGIAAMAASLRGLDAVVFTGSGLSRCRARRTDERRSDRRYRRLEFARTGSSTCDHRA